MKVSIALTTYNGEKYVYKQIQSILNQSFNFDELIIFDDNSKDNTVSIINSFSDKRIKLFKNESNLGYIKNFYQAISKTTGDIIFLSDQDDIWEKNKIELMVSFLERKNANMVCSNFSLIDFNDMPIINKFDYQLNPIIKKEKRAYKKLSTEYLSFGNVAQGCTYCFTKKVKEIYLKLENYEVVHDYQIALIGTIVGGAFYYNKELIKYRIHSENSIGFQKKNNRIVINKKISKEPFMYRFFRQLNNVYKVRNLFFYKLIYYLRIPYFISILRRKTLGE
ncbi:glycosyltransferase [Dubosiella newyorkensis]|uniref:glycosyltransferase n=1 Tax=Dubosiella newyorkensis TaxID=1862672 RepID=UPI0032B10A40